MRVIVDADVFDEGRDDALAVLEVLTTGLEGRHTVLLDPPMRTPRVATAFDRWASGLLNERGTGGAILRDLREYLRRSARRDVAALRVEVRVVAEATSSWSSHPPRVTPHDASRLARLPLAVTVEDCVNDGAFLAALSEVAGDAGERFRALRKRGWVRFAHGGGIGSIPRLVRALEESPLEALRHWVMVDHDGDRAGGPSMESEVAQKACEARGVPFIRLRRRAIENYAPREALDHWCNGGLFPHSDAKNPRRWEKIVNNAMAFQAIEERRSKLAAWDALDATARHHENLKRLLVDDIAERVFAGWTATKAGPGAEVTPVRFRVQPDWLRRGGCAPEAERIFESILRSA